MGREPAALARAREKKRLAEFSKAIKKADAAKRRRELAEREQAAKLAEVESRKGKPRCEYIVTRVGDSAAVGEVFGAENFGDAWRRCLEIGDSARLTKLYDSGWLMAAIRGNAVTLDPKDNRARRKLHENVLIGWNRTEPAYSGTLWWALERNEVVALFGARKVCWTGTHAVDLEDNRIVRRLPTRVIYVPG